MGVSSILLLFRKTAVQLTEHDRALISTSFKPTAYLGGSRGWGAGGVL